MNVTRQRLLTREEETALARRYQAGDRKAGEELISRNQLFAAQQAWKWASYGVPVEDLLQEANLGMLRALEKFDPDRGIRFLSYAVNWMTAFMRNRIVDNASLVKIGTTQAKRMLFWRVRAIRARLEAEGCPAEEVANQIARETGAKVEEVEEVESRLARPLSLDAQLSTGEGPATFLDLLQCERPTAEEELVAAGGRHELRGEVEAALRRLLPRERFIIENRVMAERPMKLQELADHFGFSRERARVLERRALEKLRNYLAALEAA